MATQGSHWINEALKDLPAILRVKEVQSVLRCTSRHVYRLVETGRIHAVRARDAGSSRVLVPKTSLADYLRSIDTEAAA